MKPSTNRSLVEASPSTRVERPPSGGDVEQRAQGKGRDPHAIPGAIDKQDSYVDAESETTEAGTGSWWGKRVYRGGVSDSEDGGEAEGITRGGGVIRSQEVPEEVGNRAPIPTTVTQRL